MWVRKFDAIVVFDLFTLLSTCSNFVTFANISIGLWMRVVDFSVQMYVYVCVHTIVSGLHVHFPYDIYKSCSVFHVFFSSGKKWIFDYFILYMYTILSSLTTSFHCRYSFSISIFHYYTFHANKMYTLFTNIRNVLDCCS